MADEVKDRLKNMQTTFENKCAILSDLFLNHRSDEDYSDFVEYADLGLPLAYLLDNEIALSTARAKEIIVETFDLLLELHGVEDSGFTSLEQVIEGNSEPVSGSSGRKFCTECGSKILDIAKFCTECGTTIVR